MSGFSVTLISLFPDFFTSPLKTGLLGKTVAAGRAEVKTIDPRQFTQDVHRTVDDSPYGGGAGMVMKPEPMAAAIKEARAGHAGPVVLMCPQGRPLQQRDFGRWSGGPGLTLIAGRYEGYDERIRSLVDDEISLGDFVLTGGEYAALSIVDGVLRLLPGTLGNSNSSVEDSFSHGLLEHPQYTRPLEFAGQKVPEILTSGHHAKVEQWRHAQCLERTFQRRPDLLSELALPIADRRILAELERPAPIQLLFAPEERPSAQTLRRYGQLALAYQVDRAWLSCPQLSSEEEFRALIEAQVPLGQLGWPGPKRRDRPRNKQSSLSELLSFWGEPGSPPDPQLKWVGTSTRPSEKAGLGPAELREHYLEGQGLGLVVGRAADHFSWLKEKALNLRARTEKNALDSLTVMALSLDRLLCEG